MNTPLRWLPLVAVALPALFISSCSETTAPTGEQPSEGQAIFDASADPVGNGFVWKQIDLPGPDRPLQIDLVASNIVVDAPAGTVKVDVAIRNRGSESLHAPGGIVLSDFVPSAVRPVNADAVMRGPEETATGPSGPLYVYVYADHLGEDAVLEPGEVSAARTWIFADPQAMAFSFRLRARFGFDPVRPHISGKVFEDLNRNGLIDPEDRPFALGGHVATMRSDGEPVVVPVDERGFYRLLVDAPGLYRVEYLMPPTLSPFAPLCLSTPNPLEVLLPPAPDGGATSFDRAHFGVYNCFPMPRVILTDEPADSVRLSPYTLDEIALARSPDGRYLLRMQVGFSGCSPEHPFQLFAGRAFMESFPVQTWVALRHDDRGEPCDAYFTRVLEFDLQPILDAYREDYGRLDPIILNFEDFYGMRTQLRLEP